MNIQKQILKEFANNQKKHTASWVLSSKDLSMPISQFRKIITSPYDLLKKYRIVDKVNEIEDYKWHAKLSLQYFYYDYFNQFISKKSSKDIFSNLSLQIFTHSPSEEGNAFINIGVDVNLSSREVNYCLGYGNDFNPSTDIFTFLNDSGTFTNLHSSIMNNLLLTNFILNIACYFDMYTIDVFCNSDINSPLVYKYGFKLENWQFWDEEADDLFPNTADLIEAELDGRVDEVFYQSLPRIEQMMNEEIEKQRKFFKDKIGMLQRNKRDNWEIEQTKKQFERIEKYYRDSLERRKNTKVEKPDWLTPDQLQEIRDLIAENRKLKQEMRKKREELSQISNDLDSSEATEAGDIQVEDKKLDSD